MFFLQLRRIFRRRPKPRFQIGQYLLILPPAGVPRPVARYTVVRKRRWIKSESIWVYGGPVIVAIADGSGRASNHIRHFVDSLPEHRLEEVRGGDLGI
jgi:hypothetical protein